MPLLEYLLEIRERALKIIIIFLGLFSLFFFYSNKLLSYLLVPLQSILPKEQSLIATKITAPLTVPLSLAADTALLCVAPICLYHLWRFIAPGLYQKERSYLVYLTALSFMLFILGLLFCFYLILPFIFKFLSSSLPPNINLMPDLSSTLDFISHMLLVFGLCFQLPLIMVVFLLLDWINLNTLKQFRPYAIVCAFILGMLLTPPDVFSQVCLALPLCALYELSILACKFLKKTR